MKDMVTLLTLKLTVPMGALVSLVALGDVLYYSGPL